MPQPAPSSAQALAWTRSTAPQHRRLRGYAFDPQLSTELDCVGINQITYKVRWENSLSPGPRGEYVEVVDYDPGSGGFYALVDLMSVNALADDGMAPSINSTSMTRPSEPVVRAKCSTVAARFPMARSSGRFSRSYSRSRQC